MSETNSSAQLTRQLGQHISGIDGLRSFACLGIMFMHITAKLNTHYTFTGFWWDTFLPSLAGLTKLFMMISGFGMCAGYLVKVQTGKIDMETFILKRYKKLLPFFAFCVAIKLLATIVPVGIFGQYQSTMIEKGRDTNLPFILSDAFLSLLMVHRFLPVNEVEVIGVSWTVGVIFIFYFLFPTFTVMLKTKKRAWVCFFLSLIASTICKTFFFTSDFGLQNYSAVTNFFYCLPLFIFGGIIYLHTAGKKESGNVGRDIVMFFLCVGLTVAYYKTRNTVCGVDIGLPKAIILYGTYLYSVVSMNRGGGITHTSFKQSIEVYRRDKF